MWSFILVLTWTAVIAIPYFEEATPGYILHRITPGLEGTDDLNVDKYLRKYGYMNDVNEHSEDYAERRRDALKLFQNFARLEETGEADEDTRHQMSQPRCGIEDIEIRRPSNAKWNITDLTYRVTIYTKDMSKNDTRNAFHDVFSQWSEVSRLTFKNIEGDAIMEIEFVTGKHPPCPYPFDGPGGEIAHAFSPSHKSLAGEMHFDDAETFIYKVGEGLKLVSVALHQSGHALGLEHSNDDDSIMVPWYTGKTTLGVDDIKNIQRLYGART